MFIRLTISIVVLSLFSGCAPRPESTLGQEIYRLMLENEGINGPIDLRDELCHLLNDQSLIIAVEELPKLNARSNLVTARTKGLHHGSTAASFSRRVEWFFREQSVHILINMENDYCEAMVLIRSI